MVNPNDEIRSEHRRRDAESFIILGVFLSVLASLVLVAAFFQAAGHARVVNACAGFALMAIGLGMTGWSFVLRRKPR